MTNQTELLERSIKPLNKYGENDSFIAEIKEALEPEIELADTISVEDYQKLRERPVEVVASGQPFRFKEKKYLYVYQLGFEFKLSPLKKELMQFSAGDRAGDFKYVGKIEVQDD